MQQEPHSETHLTSFPWKTDSLIFICRFFSPLCSRCYFSNICGREQLIREHYCHKSGLRKESTSCILLQCGGRAPVCFMKCVQVCLCWSCSNSATRCLHVLLLDTHCWNHRIRLDRWSFLISVIYRVQMWYREDDVASLVRCSGISPTRADPTEKCNLEEHHIVRRVIYSLPPVKYVFSSCSSSWKIYVQSLTLWCSSSLFMNEIIQITDNIDIKGRRWWCCSADTTSACICVCVLAQHCLEIMHCLMHCLLKKCLKKTSNWLISCPAALC